MIKALDICDASWDVVLLFYYHFPILLSRCFLNLVII